MHLGTETTGCKMYHEGLNVTFLECFYQKFFYKVDVVEIRALKVCQVHKQTEQFNG